MNERKSTLLTDIAHAVLARAGGQGWQVKPTEPWCYVMPAEGRTQVQGWKLHVSATRVSAPLVLSACAEILVAKNCSFKFAPTLDRVSQLGSRQIDRGSGGKFITIYPDCDRTALLTLAEELHQATIGLAGPKILSDRQYAPGSLVHYRYGVFTGVKMLGNDGTYEAMLVAPDGSLILDQRMAWYTPPSWAPTDPFAKATPVRGASRKSVLLNNRYVVSEVIRHSFTGSVYRGVDQSTGAAVVIKQARPNTEVRASGIDIRTTRRDEAAMLTRLAALPTTPALLDTFEQQGDFFLVEEMVAGVSLRRWVTEHCDFDDEGASWGPNLEVVLRIARQLLDLVETIHAEGLVLRDFGPNNVMVDDEGRVRLVDPEMLVEPGQLAPRGFTPGYGSPEQVSAPAFGPAPDFTSDLYSLGATLLYLASGIDPVLPDGVDFQSGVARWLAYLAIGNDAVRYLGNTILALLAEEPARRPTVNAVRESLTNPERFAGRPERLGEGEVKQLIADLTAHVLATRNTPISARLWDTTAFGQDADPMSVQHGASGILAVLIRAHQAEPQEELRTAISTTAYWIADRLWREPRTLPGLYFGRSGTAWALLDAGTELHDQDLIDTARELYDRVPASWPNPDICHGAAGAGMAALHFWTVTGEERYLRRARQLADSLAAVAQHRDGGAYWQVPASFASHLAGLTHYGFAHGIAGVGAFLLAAGQATGIEQHLDLASTAAKTLAGLAMPDRGAAYWTNDVDSSKPKTNWCSGSSGVGTFLLRMWRHNNDEELRELCHAAAVAVRRSRWHAGTSQCHGLAGEGEFLLDAAQFTGDERYQHWAWDVAECMSIRSATRDGRTVIVDESGSATTAADYGVGFSGSLAFLLRLRNGGPRMWLPAQ